MSTIKPGRGRLKLWVTSLALAALSVGCSGVSTFGVAGDPSDGGPYLDLSPSAPTEAAPAAPATRFTDIGSAIRAVQEAQSPDEAVAAYSAGLALDGGNVALQEAYVRRLVDLNAPQVAEPAARRLVGIKPDSPLAWAVIAFAAAKRGDMVDAVTDIAMAGTRLPDDPFVQRTAGELLAWYENAPARPPLAQGVAAELAAVHRNLASLAAFADAYAKADAFYKNPPQPNAAPAAPSTGIAGQSAPETPPAYPAPAAPALSSYVAAPQYAAPPAAPYPFYPYNNYPELADVSPFVDPYATAYAPGCDFYYPGCDLGYQPCCVYIGGDWGSCFGGQWYPHWNGYGTGYGYGRNYRGNYAYGNYAGRRGGYGSVGGYAASPAYSRGGIAQGARSSIGLRSFSSTPRYGSVNAYRSAPGRNLGASTPRYAPSRGSYSAARTYSTPRSSGTLRFFGGSAAGMRGRSSAPSGRFGGSFSHASPSRSGGGSRGSGSRDGGGRGGGGGHR